MDASSRAWACLGVPIDSVGAPAGGPPFGTEQAPAAFRRRGLPARVGASDGGDLAVRVTGPVRDPRTGIVGYPSVREMVTTLRPAVAGLVAAGRRPLLLGGCCALVMGAVAGARDGAGRVGVVNVDGHIDAYDGVSSPTGEAADIPVGALLGRADDDLLAAMGGAPVVGAGDAVVLGSRDAEEAADLGDLPDRLGIVVHDADEVAADPAAAGRAAVQHFAAAGIGYWVHLDVDVLGRDEFPATDYLMPGGLDLPQLAGAARTAGCRPAPDRLLRRLLQPVQGPGRDVRGPARGPAGRRSRAGAMTPDAAARDRDGDRAFAANVLSTLALTISDRTTTGTAGAARRGGQTPSALVTLLWYPDRPITFLAARLRISHPGAVQLSERLAADGLVRRVPGADGRTRLLALTAAGERAARSVLAARSAVVGRAVAALDDDLLTAVTDGVCTMLAALTDDLLTSEHMCRMCDEHACPDERCPVERAEPAPAHRRSTGYGIRTRRPDVPTKRASPQRPDDGSSATRAEPLIKIPGPG